MVVTAVLAVVTPAVGPESVRSRVIPVDEEQTSYAPLPPERK